MKFDTRILNLRARSHPTYSQYPTNRIRQCVAQVSTSVVWSVVNLVQVQSPFFFKANFIVTQIRYVKYEVIYTLKKSIFGFVFVTANTQKQGKFYPVVYPVACASVFIY